MDEVLGTTAGNALEVREAIDVLTGAAREPRLTEVTLALAAEMLAAGGLADDEPAAPRRRRSGRSTSGAAAERFAPHGRRPGRPGRPARGPRSPPGRRAGPPRRRAGARGRRAAVDTRARRAWWSPALGGNRAREDDVIDPAVGLAEVAPIGAEVGPERPLAIVHAADDDAAERGGRARCAPRSRSATRRRPPAPSWRGRMQ